MSLTPKQIIGAWSLVEWRIDYCDGRVTHPFGNDAVGQLIYSADGRMSATVSAAERPRFDRHNARDAAADQKSGAFDSYFHYAGSWRIDADTVVHTVEFALNPNMVDTTQERTAHFDGASRLTLSANESLDEGISRRHTLIWKVEQ